MRNNGFLYIEDMRLAAYLLTKSVRFRKVVDSDIKKGVKVFVFERTPRAKIERAKFLNGIARVEPKTYMERYRDLRAVIRGEKLAEEALKEVNGVR